MAFNQYYASKAVIFSQREIRYEVITNVYFMVFRCDL
jgi:hypothetical protein